jgi:integrase
VSRRGPGEGTVYQRADGRWVGSVTLGWGSAGRERRSVYASTQAEALAKLRALKAQTASGLPVVDQRTTVGTYLNRWLEVVEPRLRFSTFTRYAGLVRGQIIPKIGSVRLSALQPGDVARLMASVQQDGLSPRTAAHCRAVLRAALADAEKWGEIPRNVARLADAPHIPPPQPVVLSPDQVREVLDAITEPGLRRLAVVALHTGLRMGEELGLRWVDIDVDSHRLHVRQCLQRLGGEYQLVEPKSSTSRRVVPLTDAALDALREERREQAAAQLAAGGRWHQPIPDLCFTTAAGQPRNGTSVIHQFQDALERAGLPRLRWHDLRAAHGSLLLSAGVDVSVVSRRLGHSSVALTSRHYGGVSDALQQDATDRLARMLQQPG